MRNPTPLPEPLRRGPVTQQMLTDAGLPRSRMRRRDMVRLHRGKYAHQDTFSGPGPEQNLRWAVLLARSIPDCWISHTTAAKVHGLSLPTRLDAETTVHLSQPLGTARRIRRHGVRAHRMKLDPADLVTKYAASIASPARTLLDLASQASVDELIIVGDQLVRTPYAAYEQRVGALATLGDLQAVTAKYIGTAGRPRLTEAVNLIRIGSDSAAETLLRLALVRAGLPEPQLQVPAEASDPRAPCADMGYPQAGIVIQYDGATHADTGQYRRDALRDNTFTALGWIVLRFTVDDYRNGFRRATAQVRRILAEHSG